MPSVSDVWSALQKRVRSSGAAPLVTYVDLASGERTELSATSLANAAAKIANALRDEFDLEAGARVCLDVPQHWQRAAWCAGVWTARCVVAPGLRSADLVVTTAARADAALEVGATTVVASLHPFGLPVAEPLPPGVDDVTLAVRQQPDAYLFESPVADDPALAVGSDVLTQRSLLEAGREIGERCGLTSGGRLLVPASDAREESVDAWLACLAVPLACESAVVLVAGTATSDSFADGPDTAAPDPDPLASLRSQEHITAELRLSPPSMGGVNGG